MIKKIIQIADVHIRNLRDIDRISKHLEIFIEECKKIVLEPEETRIVICGDLLQSKIDISNECQLVTSWFLKELNRICKTYVICGNHDTILNNLSRVDSITPIFSMCNFENCVYLDKDLNYESGFYVDDDVVFVLFSSFSDFSKPNIDEIRENHPNKTLIGLIHADVIGSTTDIGKMTENGLSVDYFNGLDFVLAGHIHKRQELKKNGVKVVYAGSLIQQDFGENITGHGYVLWDVPSKSYESFDLNETPHGLYKISIKDIDDIDNNTEKFVNI